MIGLLIFFLSLPAAAQEASSTPIPIFLKMGYSTVLEFDEAPRQVVLGDPQSIQVEKLNSSVVVRPLATEHTTNMFVYFHKQDPRLFLLRVSDESEPTLFKKFVSMKLIAEKKQAKTKPKPAPRYKRRTVLRNTQFDAKKDYLTIEIAMSADSTASISPVWNEVRLGYKSALIKPLKLWAERQVIQKDSEVSARFIFKRPDVPKTLAGAELLIPLKGFKEPVRLSLGRGNK